MTKPGVARGGGHARVPASLIEESITLLRLLLRVFVDRLRLLRLELRRAARDLVGAAVLIVVALVLAATAWAGLWVGIVMALRSLELGWTGVIALTVLINLIGAFAALLGAMALSRRPMLAATLRHLHVADEADARPVAGESTPAENER
jgi:hypothetical protein